MENAAVFGIGTDRPGIVAAVTNVLAERGCSITRSQMSTLGGGTFSLMLVVETDDYDGLLHALEQSEERLELKLFVTPIQPTSGTENEYTHDIRVYCKEQPGVIHDIAAELLGLDSNLTITGLTSAVLPADEDGDLECVTRLRVAASADTTVQNIERALDAVSDRRSAEGLPRLYAAVAQADTSEPAYVSEPDA